MLELYKLTQGNTNRATITSSPVDLIYEGVTYKSTSVKRTKIISRPDLLQNKVTLQLSVHEMLGLGLLAEVNNNLAHRLIIYRGEDVSSLEQIWGGALTDQSCSGEIATITYGGGGISLRQLGDRRPFQRRCPFVLYDRLTCRATPQTSNATVSSINTTRDVLEVSGLSTYDVGYFTGGVISPTAVYDSSNAGNRFISSHNKTATGDQLRLSTPINVSVGDSISVLAGCDRTWQTCYGKFNNIINFGGFPYLPLENPYVAEVCSSDGVTSPTMPPDIMPSFNCDDTGVPLTMTGDYAIMFVLASYEPMANTLPGYIGSSSPSSLEDVIDDNIEVNTRPGGRGLIGTTINDDNIIGKRLLNAPVSDHFNIAKRQINLMLCQLTEALQNATENNRPLRIDLNVVGASGDPDNGPTSLYRPPANNLQWLSYTQRGGGPDGGPDAGQYRFPLNRLASRQVPTFSMRPFTPNLQLALIQDFTNNMLVGQRDTTINVVSHEHTNYIVGAYNETQWYGRIDYDRAMVVAESWFATDNRAERKNILIFLNNHNPRVDASIDWGGFSRISALNSQVIKGETAPFQSALGRQVDTYMINVFATSDSDTPTENLQTTISSVVSPLVNTSGGQYAINNRILDHSVSPNYIIWPQLANWRNSYGDQYINPYILKDIIERTTT